MRQITGLILVGLGLVLISMPALGYLWRVDTNGTPITWPPASRPVAMVMNEAGAAEIKNGSDLTQLEIAMRAWNQVPHSDFSFATPTRSVNTPLANDGKHVIFWDENGTYIIDPTQVAMTRLIVNTSGEILDADMVFNGRDFTWSTNLQIPEGTQSVLEIATHELGGVLGLDVSGVGAASMFPHHAPGNVRCGLSGDDEAGLASAYSASTFPANRGGISGAITRGSNGIFGAHVVALDSSGSVRGAAVSRSDGTYLINGLQPGAYTVFAEPLDGPVSSVDLAPYYQGIVTDFQTTFYGGSTSPATVMVAAGSINSGRNIVMSSAVPTVNLMFLGTAPREQSVSAFPGSGIIFQGEVRDFVVWGTGIPDGSALSFSGTGITTTLTSLQKAGSFVGVISRLTVESNATVGPRVVFITTPAGELAAMAGFLEVLPAPPVVLGVSPMSGRGIGGTRVTVQGSGFTQTGGLQVTFGSQELQAVEVLDDRRISGLTPPSQKAGPVDVTVVTGGGQGLKKAAFIYGATVVSIQSVLPDHGPQIGNTAVTICGAGFLDNEDTTMVTFEGIAATEVMVVNDTTITCKTPAAVRGGAVTVKVDNLNGTGILPAGYTYDPFPDVYSCAPDTGPLAGGQKVIIAGKHFALTTSTTVRFGENPAKNVLVVNSSILSCDTPAATSPGPVEVAVTTINGTGTKPDGYTYNPRPEVTNVEPDFGPMSGGTLITVTGTGFTSTPDTLVLIGAKAGTSINVLSATSLTCRTPMVTVPGAVAIEVTNSNGTGIKPDAFTYEPRPAVVSVDPAVGPMAGGTPVTVTGTGFTTAPKTTVTFGGTAATGVQVVSGTSLTCVTPAATSAGAVAVRVTNENGYGEKSDAFTYEPRPAVVSVDPAVGPMAGGTSVTVTGTGFTSTIDTTVTFGIYTATNVQVGSATSLTCVTPAAVTPGAVNVRVTNRNGFGEKSNAFSYLAKPNITTVSPSKGPLIGGDTITIQGSGFTTSANTTVLFGAFSATGINVVSATRLTCVAPRNLTAGRVDVRVFNSGGVGILPTGYEYVGGDVLAQGDPKMGVLFPIVFQAGVDGGRAYYAAASFTNSVDIPLDFRTIPLDLDILFLLTVGGWPPIFNSFTGGLNAAGQAAGTINIPAIPGLNGVPLRIAFITLDTGAPGGVRTVSNAASLTIRQ